MATERQKTKTQWSELSLAVQSETVLCKIASDIQMFLSSVLFKMFRHVTKLSKCAKEVIHIHKSVNRTSESALINRSRNMKRNRTIGLKENRCKQITPFKSNINVSWNSVDMPHNTVQGHFLGNTQRVSQKHSLLKPILQY